MTRKTFLAVLLAGLFSIFGTQFAVAEGYPTAEENAQNLKEGIEHAEAGLETAKAGDANGTADHIKAARDSLKEINASDEIAAELRKGRDPLRDAWIKAKKGDAAAAVPLIEEGLGYLKKVNM